MRIGRGAARGGPGPRAIEAGWTWVEALVVVAITGLLAAIAVPNLLAARVRNDEIAAMRALVEIHRAQEVFRAAVAVDEDRDGRGEHAFLMELSGEKLPRGFVPGTGTGAVGPARGLLPQFRLHVDAAGEAEVRGYRFRVWLPGEGGIAVAEARGGQALETSAPVAPRLSRDHWCAYAWPVRDADRLPRTATGRRTMFVNQLGVVAATSGYAAEGPDGAPAAGPAAGAAFLPPGPAAGITGAVATGTVGRDGKVWTAVR